MTTTTMNKSILEAMSIDELMALKSKIDDIINNKKDQLSEEYTFEFEATSDPRKGTPYVARLFIDSENKLSREFFDLQRQYGKNVVTVAGKYKAKDGDIIEERQGGSWKNDYRYWYLIFNNKKIKVADIDNSSQKMQVEKYMRSEITIEKLIELSK